MSRQTMLAFPQELPSGDVDSWLYEYYMVSEGQARNYDCEP